MSTALSVEQVRTEVSPAVAATSDCPYVGPSPFLSSDSHRFFGRDREAVDLKYRVMAHPITVLYAMSGAGKTSLINARLVPDLLKEGCHVLPSARVRGSSGKLNPAEIRNIYVFHTVIGWNSQCDRRTTGGLKDRTLKDELTPRANLAESDDSLLIAVFDQFEELFTAYSSRWGDRRGFFEQLSAALDSIPNLRVLLAMREDYLASLDPYAALVPENLRTRFRLERLRREAALEAIVNPLRSTGRSFAPGVANKLLDSLMTIHVRPQRDASRTGAGNEDADLLSTPSGPLSGDELPAFRPDSEGYLATSEFVEPVQLQVVCQNLWHNLRPEELEITAAHLESRGDVDQALSRFYEECVQEASQKAGVREGVVRRWFREQLITPSGTRGLVLSGPDKTGELPNQAVEVLEARHIIRGEERGGARWYELSHDRFIEPIVNSNRQWEVTRPTQALRATLERQAMNWGSAPEEKKASNLLDEADLASAEAWMNSTDAAELGISDRLQRFLAESREALERTRLKDESREAKANFRRLLRSAAALLALLGVALGGWCYAWVKEHQAVAQTNRAMVNQCAMQAAVETQRPKVALGHLQNAIGQAEKNLNRTIEKETLWVIRKTLSQVNHRSLLGPYRDEVNEVVFAPSRWGGALRKEFHPVVAVGGRDGQVDLWDLGDYNNPEDDELLWTINPDLPSPGKKGLWINRICFAPNGRQTIAFATGDPASVDSADRGGAWIWSVGDPSRVEGELHPLEIDADSGPVADVVFSPDGGWVATAGRRKLGPESHPDVDGVWSGIVRIYEVFNRGPRPRFHRQGTGPERGVRRSWCATGRGQRRS